METRTEADIADPIDAVHSEAIDFASGKAEAVDVVAEAGHPSGDAPGSLDGDKQFARGTIKSALALLSRAAKGKFYKSLEPIAGHERADRIASRAVIDPEQADIIADAGLAVAEKYGAVKLLSPEMVLAVAAIDIGTQWLGIRDDIQELTRQVQAQTPKPQP